MTNNDEYIEQLRNLLEQSQDAEHRALCRIADLELQVKELKEQLATAEKNEAACHEPLSRFLPLTLFASCGATSMGSTNTYTAKERGMQILGYGW